MPKPISFPAGILAGILLLALPAIGQPPSDVLNGRTFLIAATVRDFSKDHPDFDFGNLTGDRLTSGMVRSTLGTDRKPVSTGITVLDPMAYGYLDKWWVTDTVNADPKLRSYESCIDIPMSKGDDGLWEYDSYRDSPDHGFWPVEGSKNRFGETTSSCYVKPPPDSTSWVTGGPQRNGNFCMESHASFIYLPGQTFSFRGDDDVWMFINDKLVMDLGGVHTPKSGSVNMDVLGLVAGKEYNWDFFYCDRQPCGSALRMETSIHFRQQPSLYGIAVPGPTPGGISLEIWKRTGGPGSCASIAAAKDSSKAANLTFQLLDATGKVIETLEDGKTVHGGITIASPVVTIDTSKFTATDLVPGADYRVIAFGNSDTRLWVEIPFRVPGSATGLNRSKPAAAKRASVRLRNVLGRSVPAAPFAPIVSPRPRNPPPG